MLCGTGRWIRWAFSFGLVQADSFCAPKYVSPGNPIPHVEHVILMVPTVQVDIFGVQQEEGKQNNQDLDRLFASVHKVTVEHIFLLGGGKSVLRGSKENKRATTTNPNR